MTSKAKKVGIKARLSPATSAFLLLIGLDLVFCSIADSYKKMNILHPPNQKLDIVDF